MNEKPRIPYADLAWSTAFARIEEWQKLSANGITYLVKWKHHDPEWLQLFYRKPFGKRRSYLLRKGDPLLLELRHE